MLCPVFGVYYIPDFGETDTGVFFFNKEKVFSVIKDNTESLRGKITQEINFIPVISELARNGSEVDGYRIASQTESIGFNTFSDIEKASKQAVKQSSNQLTQSATR